VGRAESASRNLGRRIRRTRRLVWLCIAAALAALIAADRAGWLLVRQADDMAAYHGATVRLARVIDGDTFDIDLPDALNDRPVTRIRLWGLDCPERGGIDRPEELLAREASEFTCAFIGDGPVILRLESHRPRGTFGRIIAHVEVPGKGSLNIALLEAGLAETDERWSHIHLSRYAKAQRLAQQDKVGLWADDVED